VTAASHGVIVEPRNGASPAIPRVRSRQPDGQDAMRRRVRRTRSTEGVEMISALGGSMGMPSMDAMRQMQHKLFTKADGNGSGGLDATEFDAMVKSSPMAGKGPQGASTDDMFRKIDGDGNGELSQVEMEGAHQQMMERFQSTMQAFGQGEAASTRSQDALDALLRAIGDGDGRDARRDKSAQTISNTDDLVTQLRRLIDQVASTYSGPGDDTRRGVVAAA
jgi:hypothetical protein